MSVQTIEKMVDWVEDNITNNPTLDRMSAYVGYSPYYCSTKFHEVTGITFKQFVFKLRLFHAASEIKNTKNRFIDIAFKYGFSSQEAFTRAFKGKYGCSPSQYRKLNSI
jgi:AraC-like DNA-binding protein